VACAIEELEYSGALLEFCCDRRPSLSFPPPPLDVDGVLVFFAFRSRDFSKNPLFHSILHSNDIIRKEQHKFSKSKPREQAEQAQNTRQSCKKKRVFGGHFSHVFALFYQQQQDTLRIGPQSLEAGG
jgi:hypothetical protein